MIIVLGSLNIRTEYDVSSICEDKCYRVIVCVCVCVCVPICDLQTTHFLSTVIRVNETLHKTSHKTFRQIFFINCDQS